MIYTQTNLHKIAHTTNTTITIVDWMKFPCTIEKNEKCHQMLAIYTFLCIYVTVYTIASFVCYITPHFPILSCELLGFLILEIKTCFMIYWEGDKMGPWNLGPIVIAVVLFVLLTPGLVFQIPGKGRVVEFRNMKTSGISILVHTIIFSGLMTTFLIVVPIQIIFGYGSRNIIVPDVCMPEYMSLTAQEDL